MKLTTLLKSAAAVLTIALATPASAQQLGTYSGASADGQSISITVTTDPNTGYPEVTSAWVWFLAQCAATGTATNQGWGWGPDVDIVDQKAPLSLYLGGVYIASANMYFHSDNTVTGRIISKAVTFKNGGPPPTGALFCLSPMQDFNLTYTGPDHAPGLPPGAAVMYRALKDGPTAQ
ncbi:MAG: hypothetical protein ACREHV_06760 [Rhizomicrobium sp.]